MPDLDQREREPERLHINTGATCNNNCVFCMEEDREARYELVRQITPEMVRHMLESKVDRREMCFTTGEPTLNPHLPKYIGWAKELGYELIGVISNGRMYGYPPFVKRLLDAGVNQFIVSVHGHTKKLHDGLVRTPGAFEQTSRGLMVLRKFKERGYRFRVDTSTVVTKRNLPHFKEIYALLRALWVDHVVFNVMQANGRASTYFEQIFPTYTEIAREYRGLIDEIGENPTPGSYLVDIPPCVVNDVVAERRGYVERYVEFEPEENYSELPLEDRDVDELGLREVTRADLDDFQRLKRPECEKCAYNELCEGVWSRYIQSNGWDEFVPVTREQYEAIAV